MMMMMLISMMMMMILMMFRRVWEILLLLPTSPDIQRGLQEIGPLSDLVGLLDPHSPQKLLYTFYIIDWLGRPARWDKLK